MGVPLKLKRATTDCFFKLVHYAQKHAHHLVVKYERHASGITVAASKTRVGLIKSQAFGVHE